MDTPCNAPRITRSQPIADGNRPKSSQDKLSLGLKACERCGKLFRLKSKPQRFCSRTCLYEAGRKTMHCKQCGKPFCTARSNPAVYCSHVCASAAMRGRAGVMKQCVVCGAPFFAPLAQAKHRPQLTCSHTCAMKHTWAVHRPAMEAGAKKSAVKRRGQSSWNKGLPTPPEVVKKAHATHMAQRAPFLAVRGGNGHGPSAAERAVQAALPAGFAYNLAIPTRMPRGSGYPTCYKVDFGNPTSMLAVEVDGPSHSTLKRQAQDRKKEAFLAALGWCVLRISNKEALLLSGTSKLRERMTTLLAVASCTTVPGTATKAPSVGAT